MVTAWAEARAEHVEGRMYALRRSDVEELNALARLELRGRPSWGTTSSLSQDGALPKETRCSSSATTGSSGC